MSETANLADLLGIMTRLIAVMERETELLRSSKPSAIGDLQHDKIALAAAYEAHIRALRENDALPQALDPEMRDEFGRAAAAFQDCLARNERALKAARETTDRVLRLIVREVEKSRHQQGGYSASGLNEAGSGPQPVSIAVDQRL